MSRQRVFLNQPAPSASTTTTPAGNPHRITDEIVTSDGIRYVFNGLTESGDAVWSEVTQGQQVAATKLLNIYLSDVEILAAGDNNAITIHSGDRLPPNEPEEADAVSVTGETKLIEAYLYNTALNKSIWDGGTWKCVTHAKTSSVSGTVSTIVVNIYRVIAETMTGSITGTGTSRTFTAASGTPFASTDASTSVSQRSGIQTPLGLFPITNYISPTVVTIEVPATYTNESDIAFSTWKRLLQNESAALTTTTAEYDHTFVLSEQTVNLTDKLGVMYFARSTGAQARTITFYHGGTDHVSHIETPIVNGIVTAETLEVNNLVVNQTLKDANGYSLIPLTGQTAPVSETKSKLIVQLALKIQSKLPGTSGNDIAVKATTSVDDVLRIVVTPQIVGVSPYIIDIQLANTTTANNTATLVAAAIRASAAAFALVNAIYIEGASATVITTFAQTSLSGGANGTVGYIGQVVQAADNIIWKLVYKYTDYYYWSPNQIPAVNTEYVDYYDGILDKVVYKQRFTSTSNSTSSPLNRVTDIIADGTVAGKQNGQLASVSGWNIPLPLGYSGSTLVASIAAKYLTTTPSRITVDTYVYNNANYLSKPFYLDIFYTCG